MKFLKKKEVLIIDPLETLLETSSTKGAEYVGIRSGIINEKRISALNGVIKKEMNCIDTGYGIRILSDGITSFTSVPDIKYAPREVEKAIRASSMLSNWKRGTSSLSNSAKSEANIKVNPKIDWKDLTKQDFDTYISELYNYVSEKINVPAMIELDLLFFNWSERFINTEGSRIFQEYPYSILTLTGRVKKNNQVVKFYKNYGGLGGLETLPFQNLEQTNEFIEVVNNLPTAKSVKNGNYKAVLCEDFAWTCIHEVLGHSLEADNVLAGRSFTAGLLGMKIAPSIVTVIDDPYIETVGFYEYDSEGTKGKGTLLVEEGIHTDFLHSRETAAAMDAESSANYKAFSFEHLPQVRMSNIFFSPKDFSFEELLEKTKNGLYVGDGLGGSAETQTGEFNLNSQYGRLIENGELGEYFLQLQVSGNMLNTLTKITGIGNRLLAQPGSCVKNNQRIFVGSVSPKISVSELRVS